MGKTDNESERHNLEAPIEDNLAVGMMTEESFGNRILREPGAQKNTRKKDPDFHAFRKRSGLQVEFNRNKIAQAVLKAIEAANKQFDDVNVEPEMAKKVAEKVIREMLNPACEYYVMPDENGRRVPCIEDVQDLVETVMGEMHLGHVVSIYKRYRKQRELARKSIQVREGAVGTADVTDKTMLLVESTTEDITSPWDRRRIVQQLLEHTNLDVSTAVGIAKAVENHVIRMKLKTIGTTLIRELVNNELATQGYSCQLVDLSIYGVSRDYVDSLMFTKSEENSNIVNNNPESVNLSLAELVLKQWALDTIFSGDIKYAHDTGRIHLHDLGYPHRVYCSSHSIEYVKKYGLNGLLNLNTVSLPARSAEVLTGHLNTFLASMQANYAGALGIAYINIFYAPYLVNYTDKEMFQVAQMLIYNGSQNAFSRGGQTLFLDFNIHTGVPSYMKKVPAIGPGGSYMLRKKDGTIVPLIEVHRDEMDGSGYPLMDLFHEDEHGVRHLVLREQYDSKKGLYHDSGIMDEVASRGDKVLTYGDYESEARRFTSALLRVWEKGDAYGRVFEFPKCDFHVSDETFTDPEQYKVYQQACELAGKNGSTYFIFDRDEVTLSACCRLRTTIDDSRMLMHPENMRFCGFQNVTINIPQAAYRAARKGQANLEGLFGEIDEAMEIAVQAHLQKKERIEKMISEPGQPLYQIGKVSCDGKPYVDLQTATYIIGLIGVNDAVKFLSQGELHEDDEFLDQGLKIVAHMFLKTRELSAKYGLKFTLEETPAESASRRLARTDMVYFAEEAKDIVKGGSADYAYYTNSVHLIPEAPDGLVQRVRKQSMFHSLIESGAIIHAFVGEENPSAEAIAGLMREVFMSTQCAQVTISPEFTFCQSCTTNSRGLYEKCPVCGSEDVFGETRVVGYFSKIQNWNKSKRYGELKDRHAGRYSVLDAADEIDCSELDEA